MASPHKRPLYEPFSRAFEALIEWAAHLIVIAGFLVGFKLTELVVEKLWGPAEYIFLGRIPLKYVFHVADLFLLAGLLFYGVYKVMRTYIKGFGRH